ncbi:hypothetical protein Kpol_1043p8 [Vanderwaltozyma polyspora DSM 70294]|uniref:Protein farnesyltransferase subunit beta n=1 Tax=Vanderwaltozyma polyspora (strain ATCC 22028 / DSM 70294 / BCRC 21397 / CBS 2163 / NBRC 10782 / NRRL Y-8283 / UCD 57-17) TaxID=436907 RepID=A7TIM6_VANPO|nr:uncharacterized protein Kpol_1043p8 [Vanderwaltozyma polyspora DSM 70294]EDO17818.1 hypothetical protein Kpol_1043p8 [Vanderwaltozyma polyspora DSM 70294]
MVGEIRRAKFIGNLLGRRREIVEQVVSEEPYKEDQEDDNDNDNDNDNDVEEIEILMKEQDTETTEARAHVINDCVSLLTAVNEKAELKSDFHRQYLDYAFQIKLPPQMTALDASQPWILYWVLNSLAMLSEDLVSDEMRRRIEEKAFAISPEGGPFGGGIGQLPHLAATYASIEALSSCANSNGSWDKIDKKSIYNWLLSVKQENGGFKTCYSVGEVDTRGVYCALSVASMLNILTDELVENTLQYLINCQNYEGGFGGCPFEDEAHGGYTFCAVASLAIMGALDKINIPKLIDWCATKQYNEEKGFCGRSNKLVDGCYSFWVGGTVAILEAYGYGEYIMNHNEMREYILRCCQDTKRPGLRDKPGKNPDFYHTNYVLAGLSVVEYTFKIDNPKDPFSISAEPRKGVPSSNITAINPVYCLPIDLVKNFANHFK